jgi:hypothetical protein
MPKRPALSISDTYLDNSNVAYISMEEHKSNAMFYELAFQLVRP